MDSSLEAAVSARVGRRLAACLVVVLVVFIAAIPLYAEKALTNNDVVTLAKLGLGDDAVIAKIRQAAEVDFKLETDDLVKLKNAGVSSKVIAAMLDRSSGSHSSEMAVAARGGLPGAVVVTGSSSVKLVGSDGIVTPLSSLIGESSSTYVYVTMLFWLNFPGLHASAHTADRTPAFLIASDEDPRSRYYVVRLDVNTRDGDRSLKMGRSGMFSFKAGTAPDSDWTFPFNASEERRGTWRLALKKPLSPGEYGVFVVQRGELFDFAVE